MWTLLCGSAPISDRPDPASAVPFEPLVSGPRADAEAGAELSGCVETFVGGEDKFCEFAPWGRSGSRAQSTAEMEPLRTANLSTMLPVYIVNHLPGSFMWTV